MGTPIELEFELIKQDYSKAIRIFYLRQPATWISMGLTGILSLCSIFFIIFGESAFSPNLLLLTLFPLLLAMYFIYLPYQIRRRVSKNERFTAKQKWKISEKEIEVTNQFSESKFDWGTFIGVIETKDYFLLRYSINKNMFNILPKRAIKNGQIEEELKSLMMQKVI